MARPKKIIPPEETTPAVAMAPSDLAQADEIGIVELPLVDGATFGNITEVELILTRRQELERELAGIGAQAAALQSREAALIAELDLIIEAEGGAQGYDPHANAQAIRDYLDQSIRDKQARAARNREIRAAGVLPGELDARSAVDRHKRRREPEPLITPRR